MKNLFHHNHFLGYVNEVTPQYVRIHFPSSRLLQSFFHNGLPMSGGHVGCFVVIEGEQYGFLARVTEVALPDSERKSLTEKAILEDESTFHPSGKAELLLSFDVYNPSKAEKTVGRYPHIGSKVYACSDEQISRYVSQFGGSDEGTIHASLGKLVSNNVECNISLDALFGRHCAVLGTTGGGKSWTMAKLMEQVQSKAHNKIILIDATGEYKGLPNLKHCIVGKDSYFPYSQLSNSDFCSLFREHSPNTSTILCEAINTLRLVSAGVLESGEKVGQTVSDLSLKISQGLPGCVDKDFVLSKLYEQVRNECVKEQNNKYVEDTFKLGYSAHLLARINLFLNNETVKSALGMNNQADSNSNQESSKSIMERVESFCSGRKSILRIGFEELSYDFAIREIIVDFIVTQLLKKGRKNAFKKKPILLFIDEAHQFLNKRISADDDTSFYLQGIELIAKEARKYGLFLCLSTQMPRDIPLGILSQMGTFIVHRLINEQDKKAVESAASSLNKGMLSFLPTMGAGEALLMGVDFPMPLLLKIVPPEQKPQSETPKLSKKNTNG
jgi:hypothetical protein